MQHRNITGDAFFCWDGDTLIVNILGKPAASRDAIGEPLGNQLRVSVKAKPENGKATDYMVRFLAPLFGVRVADIDVVFGQENVNKQLRIKAPAVLPDVFGPAPASLAATPGKSRKTRGGP
ncbi:MAG TPA: DUF167 domain-containing protein [Burkholderiaceae bacterium]|nr:DUF167 domain-containing protein [Burkholderiaceae bacterium]